MQSLVDVFQPRLSWLAHDPPRNRTSRMDSQILEQNNIGPDVSVIVVAICSLPQLDRALQAIASQQTAGTFETIVAADPRLGSLASLEEKFRNVTFLSDDGCNTPIELTTMALERARGARIVLTEDSCVAAAGWLGELTRDLSERHAAIGGVVEPMPGITPQMWAFCFVDFFRYMNPAIEGPSPTLSVCNVAYSRSHLDEISELWQNGFHETEINGALQDKFGPLWLRPSAAVHVRRDVTFGDAVYERYAFGRLFGATRIAHSAASRRLFYALVSPALPFVLMRRMTTKAREDSALWRAYTRALPSILAMVAAWSWGEWLGYVTKRRPKRITTAPEIRRAT